MNRDVLGHIGCEFGGESSMAWKWTSSTGGTVAVVFWALDTAGSIARIAAATTAEAAWRRTNIRGLLVWMKVGSSTIRPGRAGETGRSNRAIDLSDNRTENRHVRALTP